MEGSANIHIAESIRLSSEIKDRISAAHHINSIGNAVNKGIISDKMMEVLSKLYRFQSDILEIFNYLR